jgi:tape measure domain-containing protein
MGNEYKVQVDVTADTAQAVSSVGTLKRGLDDAGAGAANLQGKAVGAGQGLNQVGQAGEVANAGLGKTRAGLVSISEQLAAAKTQFGAFIAAQLGLSTVKQVGQIADDYKNLEARIKLATGAGEGFTRGFEGVVGVAQRTNSNLETTGNLFAKLTDAGKSAGLSTDKAITQSLRLTETINQAVQLSGAGASASSAAITQLIQGLQSGVLRGDEFNSVMEQAPRLSKALADGLGVTTGELRKMAEAGALSADTVITALKGQSDTLKTEFATLPPTVGKALENLSTSWSVYVGEASKASGTSEVVAKAVNALSSNLSTVAHVLYDAGKAVAAFTALRWAQTFLEVGAAAAQSTTALASSTVASSANTVAHQANTAAASREALAFKALAADVSAQAAALGGNTASTVANTAAKNAAGVAAETAAVSVGRFAAVLSTIRTFTLIGMVTNIKEIGTFLGEGIAKLQGYKDKTEELARADKLNAKILADTLELRERGEALLKAAVEKQFELSAAARASIGEFDKLTKEGNTAAEAVAKIGKDFDLSNSPGIKNAGAVLDKLLADGKLTAAQFQKAWGDALKGADLAVFETQARAAFAGTAREAERLAQVMDATVREAVKRTGLDFAVISGGMGAAARSAINDTESIIKGLEGLKKQGVDTAQVLTASIGKSINTADSAKAIDAVKQQIESLRKTLGDKLTDGLLDQATAKAKELAAALDAAKPGVNSLAEAMKTLGITTDESLRKTAATSKEAYDAMRESGKASARELSAGFQKAANDAIEANKGVAPGWVQAQAAARGYELAVDDAGKTTVRAMGAAGNAVDGLRTKVQAATVDFEAQAKALDVINSKYGQGKADSSFKTAKVGSGEGSVLGTDRASRLAGQNAVDNSTLFGLKDKLQAGTLAAGDLDSIKSAIAALQQNARVNADLNRYNPGGISVEGLRSQQEDAVTLRRLQDRLSELENGGGLLQGAPRSAAPALANGPAAPAPSPARSVIIQLKAPDGSAQNVTTDEAGAQALIKTLQNARLAA